MSHHDTVGCNFDNALGHFVKLGGLAKHRIVYTRKINDKRLNFSFRIYQANKGVHHLMPVKTVNGDFGNAFLIVLTTGSFYVEYCVQV